MLLAKKVSLLRQRYDISDSGLPLATWEGAMWRSGGTFELDGRRYEVRGNLWGSKYGMVTEDGTAVASADRVGRKRWTVEAHGQVFEFQRVSMWRREEALYSDGRRIGAVRRTGRWRRDTEADLPGLPLPVQVFVLVVVLTMWEAAAAAAAGGGG